MDKWTVGLVALVAGIVAVVFFGGRKDRKDDEERAERLSIDPGIVIKPPRTGDEDMARRPDVHGDEGMVRRPLRRDTQTI